MIIARPRFANLGNGLQIVAANVLNDERQTADNGQSSSFWVVQMSSLPYVIRMIR